MKTKEEYKKALTRMYNMCRFSDESEQIKGQFNEDLQLLYELVNEHFYEKVETNIEHYKNELVKIDLDCFGVINRQIKQCSFSLCNKCEFQGNCAEKRIKWLTSLYKKEKYTLEQFEYDLIQTYSNCKEVCKFIDYKQLRELKEKGYFKNVDKYAKIHDILSDCEAIK